MKKCPFCGADIEESARFCLYCMQSLTEKEQISPHQKKKPQGLMIIAAIIITLLALAVVWLGSQIVWKNGTPSDTSPVTDLAHPPSDTSSVTDLPHTPAAAVTEKYVDSSCTQTGSYDEVVYCSVCQKEISRMQKTVDKKAHNHNQKVAATKYLKAEATCTDSAVYYYSCSCGDIGTASFSEGDPAEHIYDQAVVADKYLKNQATETDCAVYYHSCKCGATGTTTFTDGFPLPHTHDFNQTVATADYLKDNATCEDKAVYYYSCSCGEAGTATFTSGDLVDHTPDTAKEENRVEATCKDTGSYDEVVCCSVCGDELSRNTLSIPETNHTAGTAVIETHIYPSCLLGGAYDEVVYCSICGDELSRDRKTSPATGHTFSEWVVIQDPTCTTQGMKLSVCFCQEKKTELIPELGHSFGEWIVDSVATCMQSGTRHHKCTVCQNEEHETYIDPNAHNYDTGWITNATHHWHTCSECNSIVDEAAHLIDVSGKCSLCAYQATVSANGIVYTISEDGTYAEVIDYVASDTSVVIAEEYCGVPVTKIRSNAFRSSNITSVTIPNSVTYIGETAFYGCSNLTSVTIPNSVTTIANSAFMWCTSLQKVELTNGITSIGSGAFFNCSNLTELVIPDSVTCIGSDAFKGSTLMEEENGVYYIGKWCLGVADNVTEAAIKDGTIYIADGAFDYCDHLTVVIVPKSVINIGNGAFSYSNNVSIYCEATSQPDDWSYFWNANRPVVWGYTGSHGTTEDGWKWVNIEGDIVILGYSGPDAEIVIPNKISEINVGAIGDYSFYNRTDIHSVTIPNSVTSIGNYAFAGCSNLVNLSIGENVIVIGDYAFEYCSKLTNVVIPNKVTHIGDYAFFACKNLTTLTLGTGVISIDDYAFAYCDGMVSVIIPDNVITIGEVAFYWCKNLTSVTIGSGVISIDRSAFFMCQNLESVTFNDTTTWYRTQSESDFQNKTGGAWVNVTSESSSARDLKAYNYYWYKL